MVFCSNRKSLNYSGTKERDTKNSVWSNIVDIDVNINDTIQINNAVLNLRGSSSDGTIEILDQNQASGLTDATAGISFIPFINDNCRDNTIAIPFTGFTNTLQFPLAYVGDGNYPYPYPFVDNQLVMPQAYLTNTSNTEAPINANEMNCENMFNFSYTYGSTGNKICNPRYMNTIYTKPASNMSISGERYIILDENYLGPHKKDDITYWSDECNEKKLFVKIDIGASYSAPEDIANEINDILHDTNDYNDNNINAFGYDNLQRPIELPSITGKLLINKIVNGADDSNDAIDGGRKRLYGNIAVKNLKDWKALHTLNKVGLSFEGNVGFNQGGTPLYKLNRASFLQPRGYMTCNDKGNKNIDCAWYPRISKNMKYHTAEWITTGTIYPAQRNKDYYYSCLPENFMMITNITYNEDNIKLLKKYQTFKEKSDNGDLKMHFDIGESQQGYTSTQTIHTSGQYLFFTSQGNVNISNNTDWKNTPDFTEYGYSYPYFPFKNALPGYLEYSTNRSDVPNIGFMQLVYEINLIVATDSYISTVISIEEDVPHFKDNKEGNASIAFKSRYLSNWRELMKFRNIDDDQNLEDMPDGCGISDMSYFDPNTQDDSLSSKYDIGVYPIDMHANKNPIVLYDLSNTFWICNGLENNNNIKFTIPYTGFLLKIVSAGIDQDHQTYGGYAISQFLDFPAGWSYQSDYYIYSHQNQNVKAGRNPLTNVTYNNGIKIDMTSHGNIFVIDAGNTKRWIIIVDVDNFDVYPMDGYSDPSDPYYGNLNTYTILGGDPYPNLIGPGWIEVKATNYHIISTDPQNPFYLPSRAGVPTNANGNNPISTPQVDNPSHVVCGFLLFRDSATLDGNTWNISSDYALPSLHQGQQCLSLSFMDHEAVWLKNEDMYGSINTVNEQTKNNTINYISIGANNPTFTFETSLSKFGFSNLHNPIYLGLEDMPSTEDNGVITYDTTNLGQVVMKFNDDRVKSNWLFRLYDAFVNPVTNVQAFSGWGPYNQNYGMTYSDGGLFISDIYGEPANSNFTDSDNMTLYNNDNFDGLFYKLGFRYSDLINTSGNQSTLYVYGKTVQPSPLTTNPSLDITAGINFPVQDYTNSNSAGAGQPLYNRSIGSLQTVNIQGITSEIIYASELPQKNNDGFYLIYCNLSKSNYIQDDSTYSIIGNVMKNYIEGDYIYSFQQAPYTFTYPFKITEINIEIRNANGDIVALNDDNSVIFQIIRNIQPLNPPIKK